jgi:hypothetical protein
VFLIVTLCKITGDLSDKEFTFGEGLTMKRFTEKSLLGVVIIGVCGILFFAATCTTAFAVSPDITLAHGNSVVVVDPSSQAGMHGWNVDGADWDSHQWFWYRIGDTPEQSIDTISPAVVHTSDSDGDGIDNAAQIAYSNADLDVTVTLTLVGGEPGTGWSDIAEQFILHNNTDNPMPLSFFQYNNFDLSAGNDSVEFENRNYVLQTGDVYLWENAGEASVTGKPLHQAGYVMPGGLLDQLNDGVATTLDGTDTAGPGDVDWAFQWNMTLPAHGNVIISKDKTLSVTVPEPASILLLSIFGACLAFAWRCKKNSR